jgi:hypothetical protein
MYYQKEAKYTVKPVTTGHLEGMSNCLVFIKMGHASQDTGHPLITGFPGSSQLHCFHAEFINHKP